MITTITSDSFVTAVTSTEPLTLTTLSTPGPQGSPGTPGTASASVFVAGENISGHSVIKVSGGLAYKCSAASVTDAGKAIGIATGAASIGGNTSVQQGGQITEPSWSWTEGPVYVGSNGLLTQSLSGLAFTQQIGVAISPTKIDVNPQLAIVLS